jgi:hypothetical protein
MTTTTEVLNVVSRKASIDVKDGISNASDILERFGADAERAGLIGERENAKIVFLAAISAALEKPLNVSVHGASSAGKNCLTGAVAKFIPEERKKMLSGMSPKALMHSAEDEYQNKVVFIAEYEGVQGADYAIRTFQSERVIEWEFVTQDKDKGLAKKTNRVKGPAAFIQATTKTTLHPENETRLLFVEIDESDNQTRAINERQAREAAGEICAANREMFVEWHEFIRSLNQTIVVIPLHCNYVRIFRLA